MEGRAALVRLAAALGVAVWLAVAVLDEVMIGRNLHWRWPLAAGGVAVLAVYGVTLLIWMRGKE